MVNELSALIQDVCGNVDQQTLSQAASDHVQSVSPDELTQHLQTAADNASQNGQEGTAQQITDMISRNASNPQGLKDEVVSLVTNNPQVLQNFLPDFAKSLLARL